MLGSSLIGGSSTSPAQNRVFVYEVTGLRQNENNDGNSYPVRNSSSVFVRVPYNRMNEEMLRLGKMGGTIVGIKTLDSFNQPSDGDSNEESE